MNQTMQHFINNQILKSASGLVYQVKAIAPNDEKSLFTQTGLTVWSGASDCTIYNDSSVNWAFRAIHDQLHLDTRLGFSPLEEIELGRIQAARYSSQLMQDLVYIEVAGQAEYYLKTGQFVSDQISFTLNQLKLKGWTI